MIQNLRLSYDELIEYIERVGLEEYKNHLQKYDKKEISEEELSKKENEVFNYVELARKLTLEKIKPVAEYLTKIKTNPEEIVERINKMDDNIKKKYNINGDATIEKLKELDTENRVILAEALAEDDKLKKAPTSKKQNTKS